VIHGDAPRSPGADGQPATDVLDTYAAAIGAVAERTMALSSAIADVAFADAARLRSELADALRRAAAHIAQISEPGERAAAVDQLVRMRGVAVRLFDVAPIPSPAAIAAADAGDRTAWMREEETWIADRLASGTNPRISRPRRDRRDTRPDSPKALGGIPGPDRNPNQAPTHTELEPPPTNEKRTR
jgi:hypothetical protein